MNYPMKAHHLKPYCIYYDSGLFIQPIKHNQIGISANQNDVVDVQHSGHTGEQRVLHYTAVILQALPS